MSDVDIGWEDVLRRARRRRVSRRLVVAAAVAVAALGAAPALAVLLTRSGPPRLPVDKIGTNPVSVISDTRTRGPFLEYGKWQGHDGICYLVPHVHAGCIRRGQMTPLFTPLPFVRGQKAFVRLPSFRLVYTGRWLERIGVHGRLLGRSGVVTR